MRARIVLLVLCGMPVAAFGMDVNGVGLNAAEAEVKKAFPSAHCRPLEWKSDAADRRCDDAKVMFLGMETRVTYFLKGGTVQAFDVRFDTLDHDRIVAQLKARYGKPVLDTKETIRQRDRAPREIYKARWEQGGETAVYSAQPGKKRSQLTAWRGNFEKEIYRVR